MNYKNMRTLDDILQQSSFTRSPADLQPFSTGAMYIVSVCTCGVYNILPRLVAVTGRPTTLHLQPNLRPVQAAQLNRSYFLMQRSIHDQLVLRACFLHIRS
jgi:hypothetical protein